VQACSKQKGWAADAVKRIRKTDAIFLMENTPSYLKLYTGGAKFLVG
jgi:hypothetical protein